jgi:hypothetical protein
MLPSSLFSDWSRDQTRRVYLEAWRKHRQGAPLEPLEAQLAAVIGDHPEYHALLESDAVLTADFSPESGRVNPFLHMALHHALREQLATDRPAGVARVYQRLVKRLKDAHEAEHRMLEVLVQQIWEIMREGRLADEKAYLEHLRKL